jgi:excisionase family DNA binding protein
MLVIENLKFYTVIEIAEALKVTPQTVRLYIKQGRLKSQRIGRPLLISEKQLREFIEPTLS